MLNPEYGPAKIYALKVNYPKRLGTHEQELWAQI